jgi:dTDP-4-amino-4,6-dideoxygalactose transaminase
MERHMTDLALTGGPPLVAEPLPERWPIIEEQDIDAVNRVLRSGEVSWWFADEIVALEREWAAHCETEYAIAMNSGTAALHAAVAAAGVGPGDEVIVPALTFLSSATAVIHHQGIPVFVDIDPLTFNLDPTKIEARVTDRTRAIMPVHLHGLPADMDEIMAIARRHDLVVIEDSAQAHLARYRDRPVGGLGHVAAASIMGGKNFPTAGEGGLLTTSDPALRDRADMVKMFGEIVRPGEPRRYNAETMGWNYRFPPILAAFARSQLQRLPENTRALQAKIAHFSERLAEFPGVLPPYTPDDRTHVYHLYRITLDPAAAGLDIEPGRFRKALQDAFAAEGLTLHEYQNQPIPGQALFQQKVGYGRGCPWSCGHTSPATADIVYDIHDYPATLGVIESTLVVGGKLLLAFSTLFNDDIADTYLRCFAKVYDHLDRLGAYAAELDYHAPWHDAVRLY